LRLRLANVQFALGNIASGFQCLHVLRNTYEALGNHLLVGTALSWESIAAVRFGDLGDARKTRAASLLIFRETEHGMYAWAVWEQGEIERVAGNVDAARRHYESARQLFEQMAYHDGLAFYHRGLGDLAQARGDFATAWQEFERSLEFAREVHHEWVAVYAHCGLGQAALGLGRPATARERFVEALRDSRDPGLTTMALAGLAALQAATGAFEDAVELSSFVVQHGATWSETRQQAQSVLESAARQLPAERVEAAADRGKLATLQTVTSRWLEL
jgi:tetratricopeptide (TPR) repeat protein